MTFVPVATADELTDDVPLACEVPETGSGREDDGELEVALVRHGGDLYAIENLCSHGHVPLSEGEVAGRTIECYLHGSTFDLRTGRALNLPATQPVRVFPVQIDGDDILVDPDNPLNFEEN
ncbi:3-phenylpropionate/trans-cinnamate dioxygenase ferredoxin subunit [Tessaracoccus bendigoensis DSM 12906]|uniref:3-phenylpropionate/trans-cinnamate dioxygenase ferredoxin subunit n=1 Tax=Tessaracoccus bendigoensis DSM 12906 TaxID=1123357 RepID=A0A1M6ICP4_9ACTN|nr:non-heme iron oxygenase ferredoxin subunit [Tessaracoccus bendigoensis]SHJ32211.1 3-phenylpropionate/trans-cinnamate dioxygenase ferredoxin subunit [Tessaracoccus bendigoensis DSM 12906]